MVPSVSAAGEYEQKQGQAVLRIQSKKAEAGRAEIRLSDQLVVTLSIEGRSPLEVELGKTLTSSPGWQLRRRSSTERVPFGDGREHWQQTFYLDPIKPGDVPLALAPLRFREGKDDNHWQEVTWQPIQVRVSTEVLNPDLSELRDITPPEQVPPRPDWSISLYATLGALLLLALMPVGWRLLRRRIRPPAELPPDQWALRELQRITLPAACTEREVERFYTRLSDIIRRYLELRFHLPAPEQTTAEFLEGARRSPQLTAEQQDLLRDFMERCDLVKFARVVPSPEECDGVVAMARGFVEQTAVDRTGRSNVP